MALDIESRLRVAPVVPLIQASDPAAITEAVPGAITAASA